MAYGTVRLTLYAFTDAIETDLRQLIAANVLTGKSVQEALNKQTYEKAFDRMMRGIVAPDAAEFGSTILEYYAGRVARLFDNFGFIAVDNDGDLFFHESSMPKSVFNRLRVGERLKFAVGKNNKGFLAEYIEPEA